MVEHNNTKVRLAVCDSFGNLIGYKIDSFWTLSGELSDAKLTMLHPFLIPDNNLVNNLLFLLNKKNYQNYLTGFRECEKPRFDDKQTLVVVAQDYQTNRDISRVRFKKAEDGLYAIVHDHPDAVPK